MKFYLGTHMLAQGLTVFRLARGNTGGPPVLGAAVMLAGVTAAALDSYVFLSIAFHSLAFFDGQLLAKVSVTVLAFPFVLGARRWSAVAA